MSIRLKVTPEILINQANDINKQINAIQKSFGEIESQINKTMSYWEGDAENLHLKKYRAVKKDIQAVLKTIKNRPKDLLQMADLYKEAEANNITRPRPYTGVNL